MKRADYSGRRPPVFFNKEFGGGGTHCTVAVPLPMSFLDYTGMVSNFNQLIAIATIGCR